MNQIAEAETENTQDMSKPFAVASVLVVGLHLYTYLKAFEFKADTPNLVLSIYPLFAYAAVGCALVVATGLAMKTAMGWRAACTASFLNLINFFALFGAAELYFEIDNPPQVYLFSFLFTVTIFIFGYIASPKTQESFGLTTDFATDPSSPE